MEIVGTEVVPPLRDAVRFVDGDQADRQAPQRAHKRAVVQALGRDQHDLAFARSDGAQPPRDLGGVEA